MTILPMPTEYVYTPGPNGPFRGFLFALLFTVLLVAAGVAVLAVLL